MFRFFVSLILLFSVLGCEDNKIAQDTLMDVISDIENISDEQITPSDNKIPICKVGDILMPGQSCMDSSTDGIFTVLENGNGKYTSASGILFEATDILDTEGSTFNGIEYSFRAGRLTDGTWKILSDRRQLSWPLILSVTNDPVGNEILIPENDSSEWVTHGPGIWEKTHKQDVLELYTIPDEFSRYVNWIRINNKDVTQELGSQYPHWFYSHAESTIIWDVSKYDVIRFEGFYLLPSYQARNTDEDDGNVVINWYADNVLIYSSGKTSWEKIKVSTTSDLPGFYKWVIDMNFDIPQGTNELKLYVSNSDDGTEYDHFVILNPKLYTTEPEITN